MEVKKVDQFMMANSKFLPATKAMFLKEKLLEIDDTKFMLIQSTEFIDPSTIMFMAIFLGFLGVDRFMLGDTTMGVVKLLTVGGLGILSIMDIISSQERAKEANFQKLMTILAYN